MSWFSEIAERAEDLLNKVDKTAATALQNKSKFGSSSDIRKSDFRNKPDDISFPDLNSFKGKSMSAIANTVNSGNLKSNSRIQTIQRRKSENDDEKLLQFLNSNEPVLKPQTKVALPEETFEQSESPLEALPAENEKEQNLEETVIIIEQKKDVQLRVPLMEEQQLEMSSTSPEVLLESSAEQKEIISSVPLNNEATSTPNDEDNVSKLKEKLLLASKRADHAQSEMKRMQKKLDHWNSQISSNDRLVRELQEQDRDLKAVLDAKDSQLAVLKVRFEEADQEVKNKRVTLEEIKIQNEKIRKDHAEEILKCNQACDTLKAKLAEVENELSQSKEAHRLTQTESLQRMSKFEEEQKHLAENVTNYQRKWLELNERNKELMSHIQNSNRNLESLQVEYADYKQRAQRILQSKEKTIDDLKKGNFGENEENNSESSYAVLNAEAESIKQERDLLREELCRTNQSIETLRNEIQDLERLSQSDSDTAREHCRNMEEQLRQEQLLTEEIQMLNKQLKKEMQFLREESQKVKSSLQSRIQDRESDIEKLRKQLTAKSMSTISQDELESRLHALTENLIQKQTIVEALSTEKNSLVLQLERLEQQLKEAQLFGTQSHTVVGLSTSSKDMKQKSAATLENPFDSTLTRKVKRIYSGFDAFSIRIGVFFRRYPIARMFIIVYMLFLHLWVMVVLLTYEPEVHNSSSYRIVDNKSV